MKIINEIEILKNLLDKADSKDHELIQNILAMYEVNKKLTSIHVKKFKELCIKYGINL